VLREADFRDRDIRGKAVLLYSSPTPGGRDHTARWSGSMLRANKAGAALVLIVMDIPGNVTTEPEAGQGTTVPTMTISLKEGTAIREAIESGKDVTLRLRSDIERKAGLKTANVWGVLPGMTNENILIMAHTDAMFEGALDNARLATDVARDIEGPGLALAQCVHDLEALDRRVGRLQCLEATDGADQQLQLAMVGLEHVVQIFDLPMDGVLGACTLLLQFSNRRRVGRRLVRVDDVRQFPLLQALQRFAEEALGCRGAACWRKVEVDRVAELVDCPIEIGPLASDLDVDPMGCRAPPL